MPTLNFIGAYTNAGSTQYGTDAWNLDSHQGPGDSGSTAWKAGRDNFCDVMGIPHAALNSGQVFWGGGISQLDDQMRIANLIYPLGPDYTPIIGIHIYDGLINPATGQLYSWGDNQGLTNVAQGVHDDVYSSIPALMKRHNRPYYFIRPGYENNATFMPDFCGFNDQPDQQETFAKAIRRILWLQITNARAIGGVYPMGGFNPTPGSWFNPNVPQIYASIGGDVQNVAEYDQYNNVWASGSIDSSNTNNMSQANVWSIWDNRDGGSGMIAFEDIVQQHGIRWYALPEFGTGNSPDPTSHVPSDGNNFHFFSHAAMQKARAAGKGIKLATVGVWSIPASDAAANMQDGSQPNNVADLRANIGTLTGDAMDPSLITFGTTTPVRIPGSTSTFPATAGFAGQTNAGGSGGGSSPFLTFPAPGLVNPNTPFAMTVSVFNGTAAAVSDFSYHDDSSATFLPMPAGATFSGGTLSFTHPGLPAGSHSVTVKDTPDSNLTQTTAIFTIAPVVAGQTITGPSVIPGQQSGLGFNVQWAFNYDPDITKIQFNNPASSADHWVTISPTPTGEAQTGSATLLSRVLTIPFINGLAVPHSLQIQDTSFATPLQSAMLTYSVTAGQVAGAGGTIPPGSTSSGGTGAIQVTPCQPPGTIPASATTSGSAKTFVNTICVDKPANLVVGIQTITGKQTDPTKPVYVAWHGPNDPGVTFKSHDAVKAIVAKNGSFSAKVNIDHPGVLSAMYAGNAGAMKQAWTATPSAPRPQRKR